MALEITEGLAVTVRPREDTPLCSHQKEGAGRSGVGMGALHSLFRYESFMLREAHLCTQNTASIAVMLHFATFMFWLERRPFSCQCTFLGTQIEEEHAPNADAFANNLHGKGRERFHDFIVHVKLKRRLKQKMKSQIKHVHMLHMKRRSACVRRCRCLFLSACKETPQTHQPDISSEDGSSVNEKCIRHLHLFIN